MNFDIFFYLKINDEKTSKSRITFVVSVPHTV